MYRFSCFMGLLVLLLTAVAHTPIAAQEGYEPVFEQARCPFEEPRGQTVDCGWLTVPEDRSNPNGPTIRLAVATFRNRRPDYAPDPIVYLEGGPGASPLKSVPYNFNQVFAPFLAYGDFIMIDQRGTGYSEPTLSCPEIVDFILGLLDLDIETDEVIAQFNEAALACHDRLAAEGVALAAYNSAASAADLNDLRIALGYDEWNLYGTSYGTRLAQTIMRDYPDGLRSVIVDSVYPLEVDLYVGAPHNAYRAFNVFFEGCAADPDCNAAYPNLETVFLDTVAQLNEEPALFEVVYPLTGESYDVLMAGDLLTDFLFGMLYKTPVIPVLPQIIYEVAEGNFSTVSVLYSSQLLGLEIVSHGMQFSVQCNEEISFSSHDAILAAITDHPELQDMFEASGTWGSNVFTLCDFWEAGEAAPVENEPVISDIPTLILSGEYDPITPPAWGDMLHANLNNSYHYAFPGTGHGAAVSGHNCPFEMTMAFLNDPTTAPDDSCISTMSGPDFAVPEDAAEIVLEEVTLEQFGFSSFVPEDWQEQRPGVYVRGSTVVDQTALIQQSAVMSASDLIEQLTTQLHIARTLERIEKVEYGAFTWDLYRAEVSGLSVDIATAERDGVVYLVVLVSTPVERDQLYGAVMLPILEALTPLDGGN